MASLNHPSHLQDSAADRGHTAAPPADARPSDDVLLQNLTNVIGFREDLAENIRAATPAARRAAIDALMTTGRVREAIAGALRAGDRGALVALTTRLAAAGDPFAYPLLELQGADADRADISAILHSELEGGVPVPGVLAYAREAHVEISAPVLFDIGLSRLTAGDVESAIVAFREAGRYPSYDQLTAAGDEMRRYGRIAAAREAFAAAAADEALLALGEACADRGDVQEAIRCFAAAHAPQHLEGYAARLRADGDDDAAADALEVAHDLR